MSKSLRLKQLCRSLSPPDSTHNDHYQARWNNLTKPPGSLGRMEDLGRRWASLCHPHLERIQTRLLFIFAADHGVAESGVSRFPAEVTGQMVRNFLSGGAAINVLCRHYGIQEVVVDAGVNADFAETPGLLSRKVARGTQNFFTERGAMSEAQARQCIAIGLEMAKRAAKGKAGLVGSGEMGIGNTTASSAVAAALTGLSVDLLTGSGTGIDSRVKAFKAKSIEKSLERLRPDPGAPLDVLAKVGGFEIGALAGLMLGCAERRIPVVVDGFISTSAALIALALAPLCRHYLFFSHCSAEEGHRALLSWLGVEPLLDLGLRLGEGTGAAMAMDLIAASVDLLTQMATFEEALVDREVDAQASG